MRKRTRSYSPVLNFLVYPPPVPKSDPHHTIATPAQKRRVTYILELEVFGFLSFPPLNPLERPPETMDSTETGFFSSREKRKPWGLRAYRRLISGQSAFDDHR